MIYDSKMDYAYMALPMNVDEILGRDFWIFDNFTANMMPPAMEPAKLTATVSIYVRKGSFKALINLQKVEMSGPAVVNIKCGETLQLIEVGQDFSASFVVMSKMFAEDIFMHINDVHNLTAIASHPAFKIPEDIASKFNGLYESLHHIASDTKNPQVLKAIRHALIAFYYRYAYRCYDLLEAGTDSAKRLSDRFIKLVSDNFKTQRFLEFYAAQLGVTPKHLSRTVKSQTGFSAASWIERFMILEAKVLLKSTNLTVQQISDNLNFPTQSFFGKYFKKNVGMSPKAYRNS